MEFDTDATSTDVLYAQGNGIPTLTDYQYSSLSRRWAGMPANAANSLSASVGLYESLDGSTSSPRRESASRIREATHRNLVVESSAGYSRAANRLNGETEHLEFTSSGVPEIVLVPFKLESSQNGTIFRSS